MLKPSDNPPITYPEVAIGEIPGHWYVAHTKSRTEKAFAWDLLRSSISYFLPMVEKLTYSGGRKRRALMPLFPGYVFFAGDEQIRYRAMATDRLCQVIEVKNQDVLRGELSSLKLAIDGKAKLDLYPHAVVGKRCRIATGPFEGIEGTVIERDGILRLLLQVHLLGQAVSMQVDPQVVEAAG